jgi:hypothetical protein
MEVPMNKSELIEVIAKQSDSKADASKPIKTAGARRKAVAKPAASKRGHKKK